MIESASLDNFSGMATILLLFNHPLVMACSRNWILFLIFPFVIFVLQSICYRIFQNILLHFIAIEMIVVTYFISD